MIQAHCSMTYIYPCKSLLTVCFRICCAPEDPVVCCVLSPGSLDVVPVGPNKQGWPRHTWVENICRLARDIPITPETFRALMAPSAQVIHAWRAAVLKCCNVA